MLIGRWAVQTLVEWEANDVANTRAATMCERCGAWLGARDTVCDRCGTAVSSGDPFAVMPLPPPPVDTAKRRSSPTLPRVLVIAGAVAAAAVLAFAGVIEYGTHANLNYQTQTLTSTRGKLTATRGQLSTTRTTLGTTQHELSDATTTLNSTTSQLAAAQAQLQQLQQQIAGQQSTISGQQSTISGQQSTIANQASEISDLNTCLQGVAAALLDFNYYNDLQAGINELNSVNAVCTRAEKNLPPA